MTLSTEEQGSIKQYLLGELAPENRRQELEERILTDDEFFEEILVAEDELTDQYLDGALTDRERERFENHFLSTPERRQKLNFARAMKRYISTATTTSSSVEEPESAGKKYPSLSWLAASSSSRLRVAASVVLVLGLGLVLWWAFFFRSGPDINEGLDALTAVYRDRRPLEARISGFNYAPFVRTRGGEPTPADYVSRDRAERLLLDAVSDDPGPASRHALGKFYLVERRFDQAIDQFEQALRGDPANAHIHSDLGAALLEKARAQRGNRESGAQGLVDLGRSLDHLNRAFELDDSLLEPLFNRALCYQLMMLPRQARDDWRRYLERDPNSRWADEARRNLELLEAPQTRSGESREQMLDEFLDAYRAGAHERAWQVISQNRETITGKLVWQQLVSVHLGLAGRGRENGEAGSMLPALSFAGELESQRARDEYVNTIARFYQSLPPERRPALARAHELLRRGRESCIRSEFGAAISEFIRAKEILDEAGSEAEAMFAHHWISYCHYQLAQIRESRLISGRLAEAAEDRNYRWLQAQSLFLLGNIEALSNEYSREIQYINRALEISESIEDRYGAQKSLAQLANTYRALGRYHQALAYLGRCLDLSATTSPSPRQMWRNHQAVADVFYSLGAYRAAAAYRREGLQLSLEEIADPSVVYISYVQLGLMYGKLGDFTEGVRNVRLGYALGRSSQAEAAGLNMMAYSSLQLAHLYRQAGDTPQALAHYDEAIGLYERLELEVQNYDAHKGKLLCHIAQSDDEAARRELRIVLDLFEANRARILEERNRNIFFDSEQSVYDVAIGLEYSRFSNPQEAFEYSEVSRARSLLDLMSARAPRVADETGEPDVIISSVSRPLPLAEIQARMPAEAQLLQFASLDGKLLIWVISKTSFTTTEVNIGAGELEELLRGYLSAMTTSGGGGNEEETRRETAIRLYDVLIRPVEPLLDRTKQICVIPDKTLNYLPFGALVSPVSGRYLIEDFSLLYSPSSTIFIICSESAGRRSSAEGERLLSVGDPAFDRRAHPELPDLPSARREAEGVAACYRSHHRLTGEEATRERVTGEIIRSDVVHLATHYVVEEQAPMLSRLLLAPSRNPPQGNNHQNETLTDGVLQARDVYGMNLDRTRLVVLAACRSGVEGYYRGEGMIGISRTFIAAGVPLVVGSLWPVESESTAELMISFHRHRECEGVPSVDALRRAQLEMLNHQERRYRDPYYWASFITIGGHAGF
jgi:CHAT domain-containing protein